MTSTLLKKPAVWIVLLIASGLAVFLVLRYFGDAFSVLDLEVAMSRDDAIRDARALSTAQRLTSENLTEAVASFDGDAAVQTFVELEGGGKPALKPLMGGDEFTLYKWRVRLYRPGVEREVQVAFTPEGRPSSFFSKVPEAEAGPALSTDAARAIAVAAAARDWHVDFARYRALTASAVTRPGKRVDHEFVYERLPGDAPPIGDGRYRLRLVVAGDRLVQLQRFIHVPEAFVRRYETMRSVNDNIAAAASIAAGLLYGLGGCLVGLVWLMRRDAVRWAPAAKWAGVVAALGTGAALSAVAGSWFGYDTATSASTHLATRIGGALVGGVGTGMVLTVVFATAEGLGRLAFGDHPQLWRTWRMPSAVSRAVWGRTLAGYAWIGFDLAFIATFYFVVQRYLGWWSPSDALVDPNILGRPQPWLAPVSMALQAGMMEEALFRAVPLAGAALIGRRFGREKAFVVVALVLQAVVFGCAHANYPGQPAYARPIELFVPSLVWGLVYLRYGLVPGMLFHFGFDLVLMSLPLFVTEAPGVLFDRAMVIGILALPLIVLVAQRVRAGRLVDLPDSERNAADTAPTATASGPPEARSPDGPAAASTAVPIFTSRSRRDNAVLLLFAAVGLAGLALRLVQPYDAPGLAISRDRALAIAERALADRGVRLDDRWHRSVRAVGTSDEQAVRFAWREGGKPLYERLLGGTLPPPHWEVRFARFDGDVADRDRWRVSVVDDRSAPDGIRLVDHDVPEGRPGKRLSEAEARGVAEAAITQWFKVPASSLRAVAAESVERPARVDWLFRYADPAIAVGSGGEARIAIEIDGDEVASVGRALFVPDAWSREQRRRNERLVIPRALLGLLGTVFGIACLVGLVRRLARGEASKRAAWVTAAFVAAALTATTVLDFNATTFGFAVAGPVTHQVRRVGLKWLGVTAAGALIGALVAAVGVRIASRTEDPAPPSAGRWHRWGPAVAIALLLVGAGGLAGRVGPATAARVPSVAAADSLSPLLATVIGGFDFAAVIAAAVIAATVLASRRRRVEIAIAAGIVAAALLGRGSAPDASAASIVFAGAIGLAAWWIYRSHLRGRPGVIAPLMLCIVLVGALPGLAHAAYPGARIATLGGAAATLVGYAIWRWLVKRDEAAV